jgi:hypothetical protein
MRAFTFAPHAFAAELKEKGYVHIKGGVSDELLRFAKAQLGECRLSGRNELSAREIKNKKKQYLFDLPNNDDFLREFMLSLAGLTGLPVEQMMLSERHIMIYEDNASPLAPLHKDRVASQFSVGIPLEECGDARVTLVPRTAIRVNPLDNAIYSALLQDAPNGSSPAWNFQESEYPEPVQTGDPVPVQLNVQPGDAVIFAGSSMYHGRLNAAKSAVLYFKLNSMRLDPLGEDPSTSLQRENGLAILDHRSDEELLRSVAELSPRLRHVSRRYTRLNWAIVLQAFVTGENEFTISEEDLSFLFALQGRSIIRNILRVTGISEDQMLSQIPRIRRLSKLGAIDFIC